MKKKRLPIGISDFRKLISGDFHYVDKSDFIREILESSAEVILLPRPRRFAGIGEILEIAVAFALNNCSIKYLNC